VRRVELYFETYLIIALLFAIITVCIAGLFLKSKKNIIDISVLVIVLGVIIPIGLILLQKGYGSLRKIDWLIFADGRTMEEIIDDLRHIFVEYPTIFEQTLDCFSQNLWTIILSIVIGIALGILIYLLLKKQKMDNI
jgi:hypothetical protein